MAKGERPEEFDPSGTNEFQENLAKAIGEEESKVEIDIETDDSPSILTISEDSPEEQELDELPVIDTSCIFEDEIPEEQEVDDEVLEIISSQLASQVGNDYPEDAETEKKRRLPVWVLPVAVTLSCIALVAFLLCGTKAGRNFLLAHGIGKIFGDNTTYEPADATPAPDASSAPSDIPQLTGEAEPTSQPEEVPTPEPTGEITPSAEPTAPPDEPKEQSIFHFLLLGMDEEEEQKSSDLMMLLTIDTAAGKVKLTTILRDLFVSLPGIGDDKICTAYAKGGISLVYQVMEESLGLRPDGYLLFTYDGFRSLIDRLGGIDMTLTAKEADYLNKTN
ncbi:MAG: LCP family protein, partial [Lachnospiraceae bacterium]|nr:LCP family protein [Lachnospiraceae bacterium]